MESINHFEGYPITFSSENGTVMVNATEMAKPFNKKVWNWLELASTKEFIQATSRILSLAEDQLITSVRGGKDPISRGNWIHEDLAMEFARWLSPEFGIWCNKKIKELLTTGYTKIDSISKKDLAMMLLQAEEEKERLSVTVEAQNTQIKHMAPKAEYTDVVLSAPGTYTSTTIAKELGMSAQAFHYALKNKGIMYPIDNHWVLYAKYQNKGYTRTRTTTRVDHLGKPFTVITTVWTEQGRHFIHSVFNKQLNLYEATTNIHESDRQLDNR